MSATQCVAEPRAAAVYISAGNWVEYEGTAAQLIAEGLIPNDCVWPRANKYYVWKANGFMYWLRRTRPAGHKGSIKGFPDLDSWRVRVQVVGSWALHVIAQKTKELAAAIYLETPAGREAYFARRDALCRARNDKAFKRFMDTIRPKRKAKNSSAQEGDAA